MMLSIAKVRQDNIGNVSARGEISKYLRRRIVEYSEQSGAVTVQLSAGRKYF